VKRSISCPLNDDVVIAAVINFDVRSSKIFRMPVGWQGKTGSSDAVSKTVNLSFNRRVDEVAILRQLPARLGKSPADVMWNGRRAWVYSL
jgi:hypothetical protein